MLSIQLVKAEAEYCIDICLSFLYNLILKNIWSVHWGYFHSTDMISIVLILWFSGNSSGYNIPQVVKFPNA